MTSRWDPLIGKLFGAFPLIAAAALVAFEASISSEQIRSVQKGRVIYDSNSLASNRVPLSLTLVHTNDAGVAGHSALGKSNAVQNRRVHPSGQIEEGIFVNDKLQGWGTSVLIDGTVVEGEHLNGVPHGIVRAITKNGLVQQGEHSHGMLHGIGSVVGSGWGFGDTETTGHWVNNKRHGSGRKIAPYVQSEGECVNGEQRGEWIYTFKNGRILKINHDESTLIDDFRLFWATFG